MVVLFFGDIFGKPGRKAVAAVIDSLREQYRPDFVLANAENLAGGHGITSSTLQEIKRMGFNGFSSGNHFWDNKDVFSIMDSELGLLRPANYPDCPSHPCPGRGYATIQSNGKRLFFINLMGRALMDAVDCPFRAVQAVLEKNVENLPVVIDMHAETTSEKYAMGWFLDGKVSAVFGTHTHVQTADERILPAGTAYITDVGMCGSFDSVIGLDPSEMVTKFLTRRRTSYQVASRNPGISAVVVEIGANRKATTIKRLYQRVDSGNE